MTSIAELDHTNSTEMNLGDAVFKANARQILSDWATRPPFYVFNNGPPQVIVGRYADVYEVFQDAERFASQMPREPGFEQFDKFMGGEVITQLDGERHSRLRRLLMPAFAPTRIAQLETHISQIIDGMLDDIENGGREFDGVTNYAARLVVGALLTAMLDLNADQTRILMAFQEATPAMTTTKPGEPYPPHVHAAYKDMAELIQQIVDNRRAHPRSDFITDLVNARDKADKLTDKELFDQVLGILAALATTPRTGAGALFMLFTHDDQRKRLIADPSRVPDAVEECLRIAGNGYFTFPRIATRDTQVGGTPILKGMVVRPSPQAANLDPLAYVDPLKFDIDRKPQRIMTFGSGPHQCIGNVLGRKTLVLAVRQLLARFPNARLADPDFTPEYAGSVGELKMKSLPMLTH